VSGVRRCVGRSVSSHPQQRVHAVPLSVAGRWPRCVTRVQAAIATPPLACCSQMGVVFVVLAGTIRRDMGRVCNRNKLHCMCTTRVCVRACVCVCLYVCACLCVSVLYAAALDQAGKTETRWNAYTMTTELSALSLAKCSPTTVHLAHTFSHTSGLPLSILPCISHTSRPTHIVSAGHTSIISLAVYLDLHLATPLVSLLV